MGRLRRKQIRVSYLDAFQDYETRQPCIDFHTVVTCCPIGALCNERGITIRGDSYVRGVIAVTINFERPIENLGRELISEGHETISWPVKEKLLEKIRRRSEETNQKK